MFEVHVIKADLEHGVPTIPNHGSSKKVRCPDYSLPQEFQEVGNAPRDSFAIEHLTTVADYQNSDFGRFKQTLL